MKRVEGFDHHKVINVWEQEKTALIPICDIVLFMVRYESLTQPTRL
jgi:hypothetical protein